MKTIKLKKIVIKILKKYGFNNYNAKLIAEILIYAEFVNASSHGVSRLSMYCNRIKKKLIDPKGKIKIKNISNNISLIDSNNNIGFIGAYAGIKQSIAKAKKYGVSLVAVKNSGHYGLSSYYIDKAVKSNLISFCFTNAPPAIAPYGAKKSLFGTNPIAFGAPIKNKPAFIFDSSMSKINRGKIRIAAKLGKKIPYGVALDKFGKITTDPKKALKGVQLPISDFKGSGLAWMVDILSGVLTGSAHGGSVKDPFDDFTGPQNIGHLFIAFKANLFVKDFSKRILNNIKKVKKLPKIKGVREIMYPGQSKYQRYKKNKKKNINLPKKIYDELQNLLK